MLKLFATRSWLRWIQLVCILVPLSASVSARAQTLEEVIVTYYQQHPDFLAARVGQQIQNEAIPLKRSVLLPHASLSAGSTLSYNTQEVGSNSARQPQYTQLRSTIGFNVRQMLFSGGYASVEIEIAELDSLKGEQLLRQREGALLYQAILSYLQTLSAIEAERILSENLLRLNKSYERAKIERDSGVRNSTFIASSLAEQTLASARLRQAVAQKENTITHFRSRFGSDPDRLELPRSPTNLPETVQEAMNRMAETNPELQQAAIAVQTGARIVSGARSSFLPSITANFAWSHHDFLNWQGLDTGTGDASSLSVGLALQYDFYQGGRIWSGLRQAGLTELLTKQEQRVTQERVQLEVDQTFRDLQAQIAVVDSLSDVVSARALVAQGLELSRSSGTATELALLDANQDLLNAELEFLNGKIQQVRLEYLLLLQLGELTITAVAPEQDAYDPRLYMDKVKRKFIGNPRPVEPVANPPDLE